MNNIKAHQRDRLILEFGILIQPFDDLVQKDPPPNLDEYRIAIAKAHAGDNRWRNRAREFSTFAQDIVFDKEYQDISHVPERFRGLMNQFIRDPNLSQNLDEIHRRFTVELKNVNDIPAESR